jgi:hypothetical protein
MTSTPEQRNSVPYLSRGEFLAFVCLLLFSIIVTAKPAADWPRYLDWEHYFISFDLSVLARYPKSLRGLPLVQWQYGAGLLPAMLHLVFRHPNSVQTTSALLGVANLLLFIHVARNYSKQWSLLSLAVASLLLFTPAGYYLNAYSSEGWIILLTLCGLCCVEWNRRQPHSLIYCAFALGVTCYFLLLVKSINIIICGALALIFLRDCYPTIEKMIREFRSFAKVLIALVSVPVIALGYLQTFNYVTNGSILVNPYLFQDSEYSAISFGHMKVSEILFSSWHGLLFYHPLLTVPIYWFIRSKQVSAVNFIVLAAIIIQVVIQSSWYCWWMGTATYGARGFCGVSVLLIYAVMRCHQDRLMVVLNSSRNLLILAAFATFESFLIRKGDTNFTDYISFLRDAVTMPWSRLAIYCSWAFVIIFVGRWLALDSRKCLLVYILGLLLLPLTVLLHRDFLRSDVFIDAIIVTMIVVPAIIVTFYATSLGHSEIPISNISSKRTERFVFIGVIGALFLSIVLQSMMLQKFSSIADPNFPGGRSFDCKVVVQTFHEYGRVRGYERDKAAMFAFLTNAGCLNDDTGYYQ